MDNKLESGLRSKSGTDAVGYWFAAAAISAFLVAGVIIYRSGNADFGPAPIVSASLTPSH